MDTDSNSVKAWLNQCRVEGPNGEKRRTSVIVPTIKINFKKSVIIV